MQWSQPMIITHAAVPLHVQHGTTSSMHCYCEVGQRRAAYRWTACGRPGALQARQSFHLLQLVDWPLRLWAGRGR